MIWCGRHHHNTDEGAFKCSVKYADKRLANIVRRGPATYEAVVCSPPKVERRGPIPVVIFRAARIKP